MLSSAELNDQPVLERVSIDIKQNLKKPCEKYKVTYYRVLTASMIRKLKIHSCVLAKN